MTRELIDSLVSQAIRKGERMVTAHPEDKDLSLMVELLTAHRDVYAELHGDPSYRQAQIALKVYSKCLKDHNANRTHQRCTV